MSNSQRLLPVTRSSRSFFDPSWDVGTWTSFDSQRQNFEARMRDMERSMQDMYRSFNQLSPALEQFGQSGPFASQNLVPASPSAMPTLHSSPPFAGSLMPSFPTMQMPQFAQMEALKIENPIVTDPQTGNRKLQLTFDVHNFKPEEIQVKTQDRQLCVEAKHEEKSEGSQVYREYKRYYTIPPEVEPERLSSVLSPEGVLTIEAPLVANAIEAKKDVPIAITHK